MKAMILNKISCIKEHSSPLDLVEIPIPSPKENQVLIQVSYCGVCHTELDEIEGRITLIKFPIIPGHQIIGTIAKVGSEITKFKLGERVGVAWIFSACGKCNFCKQGNENLCDKFVATGKDVNGGYAEYMVAFENYVYSIPEFFSDPEAAPLLCAGAIGYRSIKLAQIMNDSQIGLMGFGASAHLVLKMLNYLYPNSKVFVFARNEKERLFSIDCGAVWSGNITHQPPNKLDVIIDTTPVWTPIIKSLGNLKKGGKLVINAIRKEDKDKDYLQKISYKDHLWMEKEIKSVANVTSMDVLEFLELAVKASIRPEVQLYSLEEANKALFDLKNKNIRGAKVLKIN